MAAWERRAAEPDHVAQWRRRRDEAFARRGQPSGALDRAAAALHAAAAVLRSTRWLADGLLEVRYDYLDDQFVSIVDANTLQVVDAGICLAGEDRRVTLESLPGVIAEAARTGRLEVTAW
jgi:hypothetical protein